MAFARSSDDTLEAPEFIDLTPEAVCLWYEGWLYCARHLTDGEIRHGAARLFRAIDAVDALTDAGLWEVSDVGWYVPRFLIENDSREVVNERRKKDRARKTTSGRNPDGIRTESKRNPSDATQGGSGRPLLSSPITKDLSSSNSSKTGPPQAVDDDEDSRIKPASQIIAERRAALRPDLTNPAGWRRKVAHSLTDPATEDGSELRDLAVQHPDWTAEQLADGIQPPPGQTRRKPERVDCDHCHGSRQIIDDDTNTARPCPHHGDTT